MNTTFQKAFHATALPAFDGAAVPEWIQLLPAGRFTGRDGRGPWICDPAAVVTGTRAYLGDLDIPVDYDHQLEYTTKNGQPAPAAAWITALEARADGVWGKVLWTAKGRAHVAAREYRYVSPVFYFTGGVVQAIESVALTNVPNLQGMKALSATAFEPATPVSASAANNITKGKQANMLINQSKLEAFYSGVSAAFAKGLGTAESQYEKIAMVIPSTTSDNVYPWLGTLPSMKQWVGDRVIRNLTAHSYSIENVPFEVTIAVKREHVEDDQVGIYSIMFTDLGAQTTLHPNQLVFAALQKGHETLCYDGQYFFDADHPVGQKTVSNTLGDGSAAPWYLFCTSRPVKPLIFQKRRDYQLVRKDAPTDDNVFMRGELLYGVDARVNVGYGLWQCAVRSTAPLNADSYEEARAAMMSFTNDNGDPLGLVPDLLVVPPAHEAGARRIVASDFVNGGGTNIWAGSAGLLVSPWLA